MSKQLTIAELMKKKGAKRTEQTTNLYISSLDAEITIKELPGVIIDEAMRLEEGSDQYAVYYGVIDPYLRDTNLLEGWDKEPFEIVNEFFKAGEIKSIATELMKLSGYSADAVKVIDKQIKN